MGSSFQTRRGNPRHRQTEGQESLPEAQKRGCSIRVTDEVRDFILARRCDFRVCTSCGGAILLPTSLKRPKETDLAIAIGPYTLYISSWQASHLAVIDGRMIPRTFLS